MIAVDSSSWLAYLSGATGRDVEVLDLAVSQEQAVLPPVVLAELFSDPKLPAKTAQRLKELPLLEVLDGYWERAGSLRSRVLARGWRARLADCLIAQSCLDHDVPLITRDSDFGHFVPAGLKLFP
ncbi:MAG: PIN domain-containing protein [Acidobacteria bacterium]|nr:PIN domain-containing protein [Acidobacteriota bacterium]